MILGKKFQKAPLLPEIVLFIFSAGISFCALIWLLTIYFMVTAEVDFLNYTICKRLAAFSYLELTSFIFIGFSMLGLLLLPSRRKIYSAALIISCLSIAFNTATLRAIARIGHADTIQTFERLIKTSEAHPINMPRIKQRYGMAVDLWRELENPAYQPMEEAYWTKSAKARFNKENYMVWELTEAPCNPSVPVKLFCSSDERAVGILADGTRFFGFANPEAAHTNKILNSGSFPEHIAINLRSKDTSIELYAQKMDGALVANFDIEPDTDRDSGFVEYTAAQSNGSVSCAP